MGAREQISWDDLKRMIAELAEHGKETDRRMQETDRRMQETDRRMQETDRRMQETDRRMQETDRRMQETDRRMQETDRRMQETDRRMQETDRLIRELREAGKETDRRIKQLQAELGRLGNRLGDFVEGFVEPAVVHLFRARGLPVHQVIRGLEAVDDDNRVLCEVDLLVIDSELAVAVECKSHAGVAEVREHLDRLAHFKRFFPRFADLRLQGAVASMHWTREGQRFAYRQGLWVLAQNGETVEVKNDSHFTPKEW